MHYRPGRLYHLRRALRHAALALAVVSCLPVYSASAQETVNEAVVNFDIPAGDLATALDRFSAQSGMQVLYRPELVTGKRVAALKGQRGWRDVIGVLLRNSGLGWRTANERTIVIQAEVATPKPAERAKPTPRAEPAAQKKEVTNMPAIMVTGAKTLNMDITRTEDDPQPYVVFDREQIERSGAASLEQFLQQRLTMNTSRVSTGRGRTTSQISLRGLGAEQTLILVDGHRVSSSALSSAGAFEQADITGIPIEAIERIEVLPTTASGIYGGSATGGVINIILRRGYSGAEAKITYENTFKTDTATRRLDFTWGNDFGEGRTNVLFNASYSDANNLLVADRKFAQRGQKILWQNNPSMFLAPNYPPLGDTPNITSSDGSNLVLKPEFGGTALGSPITSVPQGYRGISVDGVSQLVLNAGKFNFDLAPTAQRGGNKQALYTNPEVRSAALVVRHNINSGLQAFTDLSASDSKSVFPISSVQSAYEIAATSQSNPFEQAIKVSLPIPVSGSHQKTTTKRRRALIGVIKQLPKSWKFAADYTWDKTAIAHGDGFALSGVPQLINSGAIADVIRDTVMYPLDVEPYAALVLRTSSFESTMKDMNARASGPIWVIPGGEITLSSALSHRREVAQDAYMFLPSSGLTIFYPARSQKVDSAYVEMLMPLFSSRNARPFVRELDLQVALRRDSYSSSSGEELYLPGLSPSLSTSPARAKNSFSSTDPTIAMRWKPIESLAFRFSWGTGFVPPALNLLVPSFSPIETRFGIDPLRGNAIAGPYTLITGGNPDLEPEQSESWSAGLIFTPLTMPNTRVSLDYTLIKKDNDISAFFPGGQQALIDNEENFQSRVIRGNNLPTDPSGWAGPITQLNVGAINLSSTELEAWDLKLDWEKDLNNGSFLEAYFMGTWQPHYITKVIDHQPEIENAGITSSMPLKFKASAGLSWSFERLRIGWNVSHFHSYLVSRSAAHVVSNGGDGTIPSQTYHDFLVRYSLDERTGSQAGFLDNMDIQFVVSNAFNKEPPFDPVNVFGLYSSLGDPRMRRYIISIRKRF